jgi:hypothetical protein
MTAALHIAIIYVAIIWLVFFKLKLLKFSIGWGVASFWVGLHLVLAFVRLAIRDTELIERHGCSAHHPAHTAPPRADSCYGSAGRGGWFREEGTTSVPVRSPSP